MNLKAKNNYNVNVLVIMIMFTVMGMFFYILNANIVNRSDDIYYCYKYLPYNKYKLPQPIDPYHKISNLQDVFVSQINHYKSLNGRFVVHSIVQLFCGILGKQSFNVLTSLVFVFFLYIIGKLNHLSLKNNATYWLVNITFLWLMMPYPACLTLNVAFAVNYLWAPSLCLLFCSIYRQKNECKNYVSLCFYALLSLFAGQTHEGFTIGISGFLFLDIFLHYKIMSRKNIIMAVCFMLGTLSLILSPANFHQVFSGSHQDFSLISFFNSRLIIFEKLRRFWLLIIFVIFVSCLKRGKIYTYYLGSRDLFITLSFQLLFNLVIGFQRDRALFGVELYSLILFTGLCNVLLKNYKRLCTLVSIISLVLLIVVNIGILKASFVINKEYDEIIREFNSSPTGVAHYQDIPINRYYSSYVNRFNSPQWEYDAISFKYKKKIRIK